MDRNYWRSEPTKRLIEEARTKGCELCIAMSDRLEDLDTELDERLAHASDRADDFERQANQLDDKVYELRVEIDKLNAEIAKRDAKVAAPKARK